ncbi:MAG: ribonuclease HII [Verrucomicrobia bacterium]|nr:ribonuclease HII [Verrucomicrobiota bacterium]
MEIDRFEFEQNLLRGGTVRIAGVDEAGRGPLAGPVVAAAVVLPMEWIQRGLPQGLRGLNDSKQLTAAERERFFERLISSPEVELGVGIVDVAIIDSINILQATHRAMKQALAELHPCAQHVLVDGLRVAAIELPQTALVRGDSRSFSIAGASVIAKVSRDRLMAEYDQLYPMYAFAKNKGYGTAQHLAALAEHGPCPIHRRSFAPIRQPELELFQSQS